MPCTPRATSPIPLRQSFPTRDRDTEAEPARGRFTGGAVHSFDRRGQIRIDPGRMMRISGRFDKRANRTRRSRLAQQDSVNAAAEDLAELPGVEPQIGRVGAVDRGFDNDGRRVAARTGRAALNQAAHVFGEPAMSNEPCSIPTLMWS